MIIKKQNKNNKKNKLLFPTEKGQQLYPLIIRENEYSNAVALKGFTEAEINMLTDALKRSKKILQMTGYMSKKAIKEVINLEEM